MFGLRTIFYLFLLNCFSVILSASNDSSSDTTYAKNVVSIRTRQPLKYFGDNHYCGGAIIDKRHVLTAGHCVTSNTMVLNEERDLLIVVAANKRLFPSKFTQQIGVKKIFIHPQFQTENKYNIALLELKRDITLNEYAQPIQMDEGDVPYGSQCSILGWGRLYPQGPSANAAVEVDIKILPRDTCRNFSKSFGDNVICAGDLTTYAGHTCDGDAGAALICNEKLTGVATWLGCHSLKYPSFFESVKFHKDFIKDKMQNGGAGLPFSKVNYPVLGILLLTLVLQS